MKTQTKLLLLAMALWAVALSKAQTTSTGPMRLVGNPNDTQNSDLFSVWLANSTTQPQCASGSGAGVPGCTFAVTSNGNLWFAGNNASYGYALQPTQSWFRLYGALLSAKTYAPPYLQFFPTDGGIMTTLYASTTQPGRLCEGSAVPGGDCAPGTQLAMLSDIPTSTATTPDSTPYASAPIENSNTGLGAANTTPLWGFVLDPPTRYYDHLVIWPVTIDSSSVDVYSFAIYQNCSGAAVMTTTPQVFGTPTGVAANVAVTLSFTGATMPPGLYCLGMTGNANVLKIGSTGGRFVPFYNSNVGTTSSGQSLKSIVAQAKKWQTQNAPIFVLQTGATR